MAEAEEDRPLKPAESRGSLAKVVSPYRPSAPERDEAEPAEPIPQSFTELGRVLLSRHLPFQGPDIDPYLRCALEVDVAKLMTELNVMIVILALGLLHQLLHCSSRGPYRSFGALRCRKSALSLFFSKDFLLSLLSCLSVSFFFC